MNPYCVGGACCHLNHNLRRLEDVVVKYSTSLLIILVNFRFSVLFSAYQEHTDMISLILVSCLPGRMVPGSSAVGIQSSNSSD